MGKSRITKLELKVGESSHILGVAAAVHEFGGVAVSASVEFGSTLTAALTVPNVTSTPVYVPACTLVVASTSDCCGVCMFAICTVIGASGTRL